MDPVSTTEEIIQDIREGRMVIMTDDETRENEGDIIFAASQTTPEKVNFMMKYARGSQDRRAGFLDPTKVRSCDCGHKPRSRLRLRSSRPPTP